MQDGRYRAHSRRCGGNVEEVVMPASFPFPVMQWRGTFKKLLLFAQSQEDASFRCTCIVMERERINLTSPFAFVMMSAVQAIYSL